MSQLLADTWKRQRPPYKGDAPTTPTYDDGVFNIIWRHKPTFVNYPKAHVTVCVGDKDTGKGMTLDGMADKHMSFNHIVFMAQGAHDNEDLAILRDPLVQLMKKRVLILTGDSTEVHQYREPEMHFTFDQKPISRLTMGDMYNYDLILNVFKFYVSTEEYYDKMRPVLKRLYEKGEFYDRMLYLKIGEAAEILNQNVQTYAETNMVRTILTNVFKQSRHIGISLGVATQRWEDVQKGARLMGDYYLIKALGMTELIGARFDKLWSYFTADWLESMESNELCFMSDRGSVGRGTVYPANGLGLMKDKISWHKEENESIMKFLGLEAIERKEHLEPQLDIELSDDPENDQKHKKIIEFYMVKNPDGSWRSMSQVETLTNIGHSIVQREITLVHDTKVEIAGVCDICARTGGSYQDAKVRRNRSEAAKRTT